MFDQPPVPPQNGPVPPAPQGPAEAAPQPAAQPGQLQPTMVGSLDATIHTMPDKFMSGPGARVSTGKPSGKRGWLLIGVVALLLAGLTAGVYFFLRSPWNPLASSGMENTPAQNVPADNNAVTNQPANEANSAVASERDQQLITDLVSLAQALEAYKQRFDSYPQSLSMIPSDILAALPKDPKTGSVYTYNVTGDRKSYEFIFDIEQGVDFKGRQLTQGPYRLYPADFGTGTSNTNTQPTDTNVTEQPNLDADGDGLTAAEERLFQTMADNGDSDADGYKDGAEVSNFYSPIQSGAVKLDAAGLVRLYENSKHKYSFYYPAAWTVSLVDNNADDVALTSDTGEDISIQIKPNAQQKTSWDWYVENINSDYNRSNVNFVTIGGQEAVRTLDGMRTYVAVKDKVIVIAYNRNNVPTINYPSVLSLLITRLTLGK